MERTGGRRVIVSRITTSTACPADFEDMAQAMLSSGAEVVKIAVTARASPTASRCARSASRPRVPVALIAMGEAGIASRVLASWMGSCWTYAGDGVAPGQVSERRLQDEFRFRRIGARTAIYGVLGKPVAHSVSPAMHNAAFRAAHLDAVYLPLAAADFDDFLTFADAVGLAGVSVTAPFKVNAFERADECDPVSRRIQSVNTLRREGGEVARLQHRRQRIPVAARIRDAAAGHARHGARRGRRGAIGVRRAGLGRRAASRSPRGGPSRRRRWRR